MGVKGELADHYLRKRFSPVYAVGCKSSILGSGYALFMRQYILYTDGWIMVIKRLSVLVTLIVNAKLQLCSMTDDLMACHDHIIQIGSGAGRGKGAKSD